MDAAVHSESKPPMDIGHLAAARQKAFEQGVSVIQILEESGAYTPDELIRQLGQLLHMPVLDMKAIHALNPAFDILPFGEAMMHECALFHHEQSYLFAVSNPFSSKLRAWAEERFDVAVAWYLVHPADLNAFFTQQEKTMRAMDQVLPSTELDKIQSGIEDLSLKSINEGTSQVVRLVHSTLYDAHKSQASDIHLEMTANALSIKYRIDGVLSSIGVIQGADLAEQVISRIKVMSELDIAERRIPQDGRFRVRYKGRTVDFRVSILPSAFGENCVIRILDKEQISEEFKNLSLDVVGFDEEDLRRFRIYIKEPYGMVLVTGPTGSGKTTTLYGALNEIRAEEDKIITIEDPVEYQLQGIMQIPVNEKKGLTFARGLRSILRHDPDKIMVGEIRDEETAQIAIQSALTGHLVFTTVHANNVIDVIGRFLNMGVEPYNFVSSLNCVLAQRLVRLLCPTCKRPYTPSIEELADSALKPSDVEGHTFYRNVGCDACNHTGYRGRSAIHELLDMSDRIREMIIERRPGSEIRRQAEQEGLSSLRESAVKKVFAGLTTLHEINRVTFVEELK